jgi:8-oxo-dGTP pyrophosphatase MutT (NUDIX family)
MPKIVSDVVDVYVFRRDGKRVEFLLLKRSSGRRLAGTWQAVHGRIQEGETAVQAALRELHEEIGLRPVGFWQLEYVNTFYMVSEDTLLMCPCFAAEIDPAAEIILSDEHTAYRWEPTERALEGYMWPGQRHAVREVMAAIVTPGLAEPHMRIIRDGGPPS